MWAFFFGTVFGIALTIGLSLAYVMMAQIP